MAKVQIIVLFIVLLGCQPRIPDLREDLDGWETSTTYKVLPHCAITVEGKRYKIIPGRQNVLVIELERKPIFKPGHTVTDLASLRTLLIELDPLDSVVRPSQLGRSKILREILAFSPSYGTHEVSSEEKIEIKKVGPQRWSVISDLVDFQFQGQFTFGDSSTVTSRQKQMFN